MKRRNTLSNIFYWNTTSQLPFCISNVVYLTDLQMSIFKHFSVHSVKSEFWNNEKVEFHDFFIASCIWTISNMKAKYAILKWMNLLLCKFCLKIKTFYLNIWWGKFFANCRQTWLHKKMENILDEHTNLPITLKGSTLLNIVVN